jgi:hypothetical protein
MALRAELHKPNNGFTRVEIDDVKKLVRMVWSREENYVFSIETWIAH